MALLSPFSTRVTAVAVGTILEYYDFAVFGSLADVIGDQFFPNVSKLYSLLASLSVYGSAFLMRPLGGLFLGIIGDTIGRQRALEISILLMLFPSFLIGCLPPYTVGGIYSSIALVVLRLLQGIAVGGEMVGAFVFTVESADGDKPGFWGSIMKSTSLMGNALGLGVATTLRHYLSNDQFQLWGWRVPFFLALLLALLGLHLRAQIRGDDPSINNIENEKDVAKKEPFSCLGLMAQWRELLLVSAVVALWVVGYYTCFVWLVYFNTSLMYGGDLVVANAWWINLGMTLVLIFLFPIGGTMGDMMTSWYGDSNPFSTSGFRAVMMLGAAILVVGSLPAFYLISGRDVYHVCGGQMIFGVALALYGGNMPVYLVYKFPPASRYTGVGLGYNVANAIFASSAAVVQTSLSMADHISPSRALFPSLYLCAIAFLSFVALLVFDPLVQAHHLKRNTQMAIPLRDMREVKDIEVMDTSEGSCSGQSIDISTRSTSRLVHQ